MTTILKIILIGIGGTFAVDIWTFILSLFKIKSLDYRYVGRWIAYFPKGKIYHNTIMMTAPVRGELLMGWSAHYLIGISFAFLLILLFGKEWLDEPLILPALIVGIITVISPLFIMQPAFGFGIASSKLSDPNLRRLKSMLTHVVYGFGLYLSAVVLQQLWS